MRIAYWPRPVLAPASEAKRQGQAILSAGPSGQNHTLGTHVRMIGNDRVGWFCDGLLLDQGFEYRTFGLRPGRAVSRPAGSGRKARKVQFLRSSPIIA